MSEGNERRGFGWRLLALYLLVLAASHLVRALTPEPEPGAGADLRTIAADGAVLAWSEWAPADPEPLPVVLLHGSPGSRRDFRTLGPALGRRYRTLAPDLPGFGAATRRVEDYSNAAHARYVLQGLDELGIERAHLVGFSMGGGVALRIAEAAPERAASITLLSSIGVQEYELLGEYTLNHHLHELQLAFLWLMREAVPHFGVLDGAFFGVEYARNFYDTDQRPYREVLADYPGRVLIVHGRNDFLVPYAAALENHRVAPRSELVTLDANHFFVFGQGERIAERLFPFLAGGPPGAKPPAAAPAEPPDPRYLGFSVQELLVTGASLLRQHSGPFRAGRRIAAGALDPLAVLLATILGPWVVGGLFFALGRTLRLKRADLSRWSLAVLALGRLIPFAWLPACFACGAARVPFRDYFWRSLLLSALFGAALPVLGWLSA